MSGLTAALVVATGSACLDPLPPARTCPPAAVYEYCAPKHGVASPSPVEPGPSPPSSCEFPNDECLTRPRGGSCACTDDCTSSAATCFPPPTCPSRVTEGSPGARCLEATPAPVSGECICDCATCAHACDGRGPILGPATTLRLTLPADLAASGKLGTLLRMRGDGAVVVYVELPGDELRSFSVGEYGLTGVDAFVDRLPGGSSTDVTRPIFYSWSSAADRPVAIRVVGQTRTELEIDCVIPWVE